MIPFHESGHGRRFFDDQLPKLITALTDIAAALKAPQPVYQLKTEAPKGFLSDLYHGSYDPSDQPNAREEVELTPEIITCQRQLRETVPPETWELIDRYSTLLSSRSVIQREQAFAAGFRSAMTILAAGLMAPTVDKEHRPG